MNEAILYGVVCAIFGVVFVVLILEWIKQYRWEFNDDE